MKKSFKQALSMIAVLLLACVLLAGCSMTGGTEGSEGAAGGGSPMLLRLEDMQPFYDE